MLFSAGLRNPGSKFRGFPLLYPSALYPYNTGYSFQHCIQYNSTLQYFRITSFHLFWKNIGTVSVTLVIYRMAINTAFEKPRKAYGKNTDTHTHIHAHIKHRHAHTHIQTLTHRYTHILHKCPHKTHTYTQTHAQCIYAYTYTYTHHTHLHTIQTHTHITHNTHRYQTHRHTHTLRAIHFQWIRETKLPMDIRLLTVNHTSEPR